MRVLVCVKRVPEIAGRITLTDDARVKSTVDSFLADLESQVAQRGAGA